MTTDRLFEIMRDQRVQVVGLRGGNLVCVAPKGRMADNMRTVIHSHKDEIVKRLKLEDKQPKPPEWAADKLRELGAVEWEITSDTVVTYRLENGDVDVIVKA